MMSRVEDSFAVKVGYPLVGDLEARECSMSNKTQLRALTQDVVCVADVPLKFLRERVHGCHCTPGYKNQSVLDVLCLFVVFIGQVEGDLVHLAKQANIRPLELATLADELSMLKGMALEALSQPKVVPNSIDGSFEQSNNLFSKAGDGPEDADGENTDESSFDDSGNADSVNHF